LLIAWHDDSANTLYLQINDGTPDSASFSGSITDGSGDFMVGSRNGTERHYDGLIDEVAIFDDVLTSAERTWLYNSGSGRSYTDLSTHALTATGITANPVLDTPVLAQKHDLTATGITVTPVLGAPVITSKYIPPLPAPITVPPLPRIYTPVYVLDIDLDVIGIIEDYYSLTWAERYYEAGDFEMELPIDYALDSNIDFGNFLYIRASDKLMIIEDIKPSTSAEKTNLLIKGQSAESILKRRVLLYTINVDNYAETIVYNIMDRHITDPPEAGRKISLFKTTFPSLSTTIWYENQFKEKTVYEAVEAICKNTGLGFKVIKEADKLAFSVYEGVDRSYDQDTVPYVVFSDTFDNVIASSFYDSVKDKVNLVLVRTNDNDGTFRMVFVWEEGTSEPTDLDRYETSLDTEIDRMIPPVEEPEPPNILENPRLGIVGQDNLHAIGITTTPKLGVNTNEPDAPPPPPQLSDSEMLAIVNTRGREVIEERKTVGLFEGDFDIQGNFKFDVDFFMGDIVQCSLEGRNIKARITELVRSYSVEGETSYLVFDFII
jgi:hypothetical protein